MATAPSAEASLREQIDSLPTSTVKDLLLQAAMRDHAVATRVSATSRVARIEEIVKTTSAHMMEMWTAENKRLEALAAESKRVIDFDSYSKSAWHELNTKHACASGSREYEYALFFFFFFNFAKGYIREDLKDSPGQQPMFRYERNAAGKQLANSRCCSMAGDAEDAIKRMLDEILDQTKLLSSYGTKKSAVET